MKKILVVSLLLMATGCVGIAPDLIDTSVQNITLRHDAYVTADQTLTDSQRAAFLQEADLLRQVVEEAKK